MNIYNILKPKGKLKLTFLLFLSSATTQVAFAQWTEQRYPQEGNEIQLYATRRVSDEVLFLVDDKTKEKNVVSYRAFDERGLLQLSREFKRRRYFDYDSLGNVVNVLDSATNKGNAFTVNRYRFAYNDLGILTNALPIGRGVAEYNFDANTKTLLGTWYYKEGKSAPVSYTFSDEGLMVSMMDFDDEDEREIRGNYIYSDSFTALRDIEVEYPKSGGVDSFITRYTYDTTGLLARKETIAAAHRLDLTGAKPKPTVSTGVQSWSYLYNKRGQKIQEAYINPAQPDLNYLRKFTFRPDGLVSGYSEQDSDGEVQQLVYEYRMFSN